MSEFEFTLVIEGPVMEDTTAESVFEAGCDDATFGAIDGTGYGEFIREASSFKEAVSSAIRDIESVGGLSVIRVEPDDLVTLAEIAERVGRTRESVRLLASGERGSGGFPTPASHLRARSRLWRWSEVAAWFGSDEEMERARSTAAVNAALELRRLRPGDAAMRRTLAGVLG